MSTEDIGDPETEQTATELAASIVRLLVRVERFEIELKSQRDRIETLQTRLAGERRTDFVSEREPNSSGPDSPTDRLLKLLRVGPAAVVARVEPVHEYARALLVGASKLGTLTDDAGGRRLSFLASDVKPRLEAHFERSLTLGDVERTFEVVAELGANSPRRVTTEKTVGGDPRLLVWKPDPILALSRATPI